MFYSSLRRTLSDQDCNGWSDPGGKGFMVRSRTYNVDNLKVSITLFIFLSYQKLQFKFTLTDAVDVTRCRNFRYKRRWTYGSTIMRIVK